MAKQHDDGLIDRHNGGMEASYLYVLHTLCRHGDSIEGVIQADLFSVVSSAFIINIQSSLSPSISITTKWPFKKYWFIKSTIPRSLRTRSSFPSGPARALPRYGSERLRTRASHEQSFNRFRCTFGNAMARTL